MRDLSPMGLALALGVLVFASQFLHSEAGRALQTGSAVRERTLGEIVTAPVPLRDGIGEVSERLTTTSPQANAFCNQGLAYLHSFVWIEAARSFNQALRVDRNLAIAYVGLSYALSELGLSAEARSASDRAHLLADSVSPREKVRIELRKEQLDAAVLPESTALRAAYRKKLDEALAAFPDDIELLLLVGQAQDPSHDGHGMNVGSNSLPFYQRALEDSPDYFATHHFLVHAYENTRQFDQALVHAERYARLAYAVPHAHHMHGHVLRRLDRMKEAIAEFEKADQIETAYFKAEAIPPQHDWHYRHNLSLLGTSYQYAGRMAAADAVLRRSFELDDAALSAFDLDRKQWVMLLLARGRPAEAFEAAKSLVARPRPLWRALGHLLASRALLALKRPDDAAGEGNMALGDMRTAGSAGGVLVPEYEVVQGEFLLRTGQLDSGRTMLRAAAAKLHDASGPDAWVMTLFNLEAIARTAAELGDWPLVQYFGDEMRDLDSTYPGTRYVLGLLAEHDGDRSAARARYQEAVRGWADADPDFAALRDARRRMAGLDSGNPPARRP
jgi:tetratricopeptide (TPR) repeat protein